MNEVQQVMTVTSMDIGGVLTVIVAMVVVAGGTVKIFRYHFSQGK